jgi:hypothetical protein
MFRSRNEWFVHELQNHRRHWICVLCATYFNNRTLFSNHLEIKHQVSTSDPQFGALVLQSEEAVDTIPADACPFCDEWEETLMDPKHDARRAFLNDGQDVKPYGTLKQFRRHLGSHMEQLALFALPMADNEDLEDDSASGHNEDSEDSASVQVYDDDDDGGGGETSVLHGDTVDNAMFAEEQNSKGEGIEAGPYTNRPTPARDALSPAAEIQGAIVEEPRMTDEFLAIWRRAESDPKEVLRIIEIENRGDQMRYWVNAMKVLQSSSQGSQELSTTSSELNAALSHLATVAISNTRTSEIPAITFTSSGNSNTDDLRKHQDLESQTHDKSSGTGNFTVGWSSSLGSTADAQYIGEAPVDTGQAQILIDAKDVDLESWIETLASDRRTLETMNPEEIIQYPADKEQEYLNRLVEDFRKSGMDKEQIQLSLQKDKKDYPDRPTSTRMSRKQLSLETLKRYTIDFEIDTDPDYLLIKRWVPEYEQEFLWNHTRELRQKRAENAEDIATSTFSADSRRSSGDTELPEIAGEVEQRRQKIGEDDNVELISIESHPVGLIIGRKGENLRRIEAETGCRLQIVTGPNVTGPYRQCKITGTRAARAKAKAEINRIIDDRGNRGMTEPEPQGLAAPVAPMGQQHPMQMPDGMNVPLPGQFREPTPQEIINIRNHPSWKMAQATDDQIRNIFMRNQMQQQQQQQQQQQIQILEEKQMVQDPGRADYVPKGEKKKVGN